MGRGIFFICLSVTLMGAPPFSRPGTPPYIAHGPPTFYRGCLLEQTDYRCGKIKTASVMKGKK